MSVCPRVLAAGCSAECVFIHPCCPVVVKLSAAGPVLSVDQNNSCVVCRARLQLFASRVGASEVKPDNKRVLGAAACLSVHALRPQSCRHAPLQGLVCPRVGDSSWSSWLSVSIRPAVGWI